MLKPDPGDTLAAILTQLQGTATTNPTEPFTPPNYAIRVNCFLFVGLFISIMVALLSILVKQWTRAYQRDLAGVSSQHLRARIRHFRYNGAEKWHLSGIVGLLSISMHCALFVSAIGIIDLLFATARTVGIVALSIFLVATSFFVVTTIIPLFFLDAPFRSPISKLFLDLKRMVHRPDYLRRKKGTDDEGLDDHMEQSQTSASEADSIVRTQLHLDLDILSDLLGAADKSTERWMLDLCFEKLPTLSVLARQNPSLILNRNILLEVYNFLSKGCVTLNKHGKAEVHPNRISRAKQLCKFLAWFLSLRRTTEERRKLETMLKKEKMDPYVLPEALANDVGADESVVAAAAALGRLDHLFKMPLDGPDCPICAKFATELRDKVPSEPIRNEELIQEITKFLIWRSDCLLFWNWQEEDNWKKTYPNVGRDPNAKDHLPLIRRAMESAAANKKEKQLWRNQLIERKSTAAQSLVEFWFDPLIKIIDELPVTNSRSPSPFPAPRAGGQFGFGGAGGAGPGFGPGGGGGGGGPGSSPASPIPIPIGYGARNPASLSPSSGSMPSFMRNQGANPGYSNQRLSIGTTSSMAPTINVSSHGSLPSS